MIPKDVITKQHVLDAIAEIDQNGVPVMRHAKGFDLVYQGKTYPPKYVLSLAAKHGLGRELDPAGFSGGEPTNKQLRALGFEVVARSEQAIRDGLEKVMQRYVAARAGERFGREHELWKVFAGLKESIGDLESIHNPDYWSLFGSHSRTRGLQFIR